MNNSYRSRIPKVKKSDVRMSPAEHGRGRGPREAVKLTVEQLEPRTLLAGDLAAFDAAEGEASVDETSPTPLVALVLQVTKPDGTSVDSIHVGDTFVLHVLTQDLRAEPHGVFAAYFDLLWDGALAAVAGPQQFGDAFPNGHKGDAAIAGTLDEAGAFASTDELDGKLYELFSLPLQAIAPGTLTLLADPADIHPEDDVLIFGTNDIIDSSFVDYGSASLIIAEAIAEPTAPAAELPTVVLGPSSEIAPTEGASSEIAVELAPPIADEPEALVVTPPEPAAASAANAAGTPVLLLSPAAADKLSQPASANTTELSAIAPTGDPDAPEESPVEEATAKTDLALL